MKYFAPLSSPKQKHLKMKNDIDFYKLSNGKLGAINFNNMIPVPDGSYTLIGTKTQSLTYYYKFLIISFVNASVEALPPRSKVNTFLSSNVLFNAFRIFVATLS